MIESAIIALREGIEIALVIGLLIVYLRKLNQGGLVIWVYGGLILAVGASFGGAFVLERFSIDQESLEGWFELAAAVFVMTMITWMWLTSKKIRSNIEEKVNAIVESPAGWKTGFGILSFTFLMVFREGLETAVFLQAVAFSSAGWAVLAGTLAGVAIATAFAVLFIRGSVRIDIARFLKVTAITLLVFTLQLIANALHEFYEYGVFAANPAMMGILGPIVQHDLLFIAAIVSIPAIMMIFPGNKGGAGTKTGSSRKWQLAAAAGAIGIICFLGVGDIFSGKENMDFSAQALTPSGGLVTIPLAGVGDGALHRYSINDQGLEIRFFVIRLGVGKFATAFDACHACYSYGHYYLKEGQLICSQCDAPAPLSKLHPSLGEEGVDPENSGSMEGNGCYPIYLPSRIRNGAIEVTLADLRSQRKYFDISPVQ